MTPSPARSNAADAIVTATTATSTAGTFGTTRGRTSSTASTASPVTSVVVLVSPTWRTNCSSSSTNPSASVEKPNSFGSCPTMIVMASPFM